MPKFTGARENEVFIGNVPASGGIPEYLAGLKTVRLGERALDIDGKHIPGYRPVFIDRSEEDAYDRIMQERLSAIRKGRAS